MKSEFQIQDLYAYLIGEVFYKKKRVGLFQII